MTKVLIDAARCKGCGLCVNACPKGVLTLDSNVLTAKGYHPAAVTDIEKCIGCMSCAVMCPDCAITIEK